MGKGRFLFLAISISLTSHIMVLPGKAYSDSALDGFDPNANDLVSSIAVQADGKILVGDYFTREEILSNGIVSREDKP
jgi:hypothetical protein